MRKVLAIVIAAIAVLCLAGVAVAFAMSPKPAASRAHQQTIATPSAVTSSDSASATPAPPGTVYTTDATIGDIPGWIAPSQEPLRAHSIHVWLATVKCMQKLGYTDFHYRVYWMPGAVAPDSENFWTDGLSAAKADEALTAEFGPTHVTLSGDGCYGHARTALQHQFQDGH